MAMIVFLIIAILALSTYTLSVDNNRISKELTISNEYLEGKSQIISNLLEGME